MNWINRIILLGILGGLLISAQTFAESRSVSFKTLGVCVLCKFRIEAAVNKIAGVDSVDYNPELKVTKLTYDVNVTDPFIVMHAIAAVGHDTEWFPAPDSMYNTLVHTCCEYQRTIDYSLVQPGWLSLMGIWVSPLSLQSMPVVSVSSFMIPSGHYGNFSVQLPGKPDDHSLSISVYSVAGRLAYSGSFETDNRLDLSFLKPGAYVAVLSGRDIRISQSILLFH